MAQSNDGIMARLDGIETAIVRITDVIVLQSERMDALREEARAARDEARGEAGAIRDEMRVTRETLTDRLDRLIAITMKERTAASNASPTSRRV
jgi:hypothetical protein